MRVFELLIKVSINTVFASIFSSSINLCWRVIHATNRHRFAFQQPTSKIPPVFCFIEWKRYHVSGFICVMSANSVLFWSNRECSRIFPKECTRVADYIECLCRATQILDLVALMSLYPIGQKGFVLFFQEEYRREKRNEN